MVLPFAAARGASSPVRAARTTPLGSPRPIIVQLFPGAGSERFSPTFSALMDHYRRTPFSYPAPYFHTRLIRSLAGAVPPTLTFGLPFLDVAAIDDFYAQAFGLMEDHGWSFLHFPVSTSMLGRLTNARVVYLFRDPRDIYVTWYHRLVYDGVPWNFGMLRQQPKEEVLLQLFEGLDVVGDRGDWLEHFPSLRDLAQGFVAIADHPHIYGVRYEDVRLRPLETYRALLAWLGLDRIELLPLLDLELEAHIHKGSFEYQSGGKLKEGQGAGQGIYRPAGLSVTHNLRMGLVGDWRQHYTERMKKRVKELVGPDLVRLGYEKDLEW